MRKTVTVLFSSVGASTPQGRSLDPETRRRVMSRYFEDVRAVLERHGGTVEAYPGDAVMAVFGVPLLHEDDALRAVRAASEMRDALPALADELERAFGVRTIARVGVGTGEVIATHPAGDQPLATGEAVNFAKRLEELAGAGEILIDDKTHRLVQGCVQAEPAGDQTLRSGESLAALRLVEVRLDAAGRVSPLESPLVNRERQLGALTSSFTAAVSDRACHLVTVLGAAGVGKSRLVHEFIGGLGDEGSVLRGRCLPYGEGITYWPLAEIVSDMTGAGGHGPAVQSVPAIAEQLADEPKADLIVAGVAEALGIGGSKGGTSEKIFWSVRRLFEAVARRHPLVVVFDDLQWAEPTFLDLVEHVADLSRDAPIMVLCMARPELLDTRPGWGGGKLNATSILLEPLSEDETRELIANLLSRATLPHEAAARIAEATEGNPLFAEELLAMLIDEGLLRREDGHWTAADELADLPVPPTIHALLAARLEALPDDERALLAHASVEGTLFHREALDELAPASLEASRRAEPDVAGPKGRDPPRSRGPWRGRSLPLPPHADPRRRLSLALEGDAGGAARAICGLARANRGVPARRVRGDRRLPPRAGLPLPRGARDARPRRRGTCRARGGTSRVGGAEGPRAERPPGGRQPARARCRPPPG